MPRKRLRPEPLPSTTQRWVVTYTDLCTLLLSFFVLLVSMSTLDGNRQKKVLGSLEGSFGDSDKHHPVPDGKPSDTEGNGVEPEKQSNFPGLKALSVDGNLSADQVLVGKHKTMIRIEQKVLFRPGTTELNPETQNYLNGLAGYLSRNETTIEVRGHTDLHEGLDSPNWPVRSWELSVRRAQAVYGFFLQKDINPGRMSAHGFSYFQPLVDSRKFPQLSEKNQRVEIILGPSQSIPSELIRQNRQSNPFVNYRDFFFKLYSPNEEKDKELEPWVRKFHEAAEAQEEHRE